MVRLLFQSCVVELFDLPQAFSVHGPQSRSSMLPHSAHWQHNPFRERRTEQTRQKTDCAVDYDEPGSLFSPSIGRKLGKCSRPTGS